MVDDTSLDSGAADRSENKLMVSEDGAEGIDVEPPLEFEVCGLTIMPAGLLDNNDAEVKVESGANDGDVVVLLVVVGSEVVVIRSIEVEAANDSNDDDRGDDISSCDATDVWRDAALVALTNGDMEVVWLLRGRDNDAPGALFGRRLSLLRLLALAASERLADEDVWLASGLDGD